jgi:cysteine desulfurase
MTSKPVYLDYNATTPVDKKVLEQMLPFFSEEFGNASSSHVYGRSAAAAVNEARASAALLIGCEKEEIIFTSGATESINLALRGVVEVYQSKGNHIITCATEHRAVLDTCHALSKKGIHITTVPVNKEGAVDLAELEQAIQPSTILIVLMYANNETGLIHPVEQIGRLAKKHKALFFCDATQATGKIPVDVIKDEIDLLAFSSHKLYGPKGCGGLYVRRKNPRVQLKEQLTGGGHERNLRSGTLNVPGIVGFGKAALLCKENLLTEMNRIQQLRDAFEQAVCKETGAVVNGSIYQRLPNTSNLCFDVPNGLSLLNDLSSYVAASSGSACSSAKPEASHVLSAMGLDDKAAKSSIRFSFGRMTTQAEMEQAASDVCRIVQEHLNG